MTTASAYDVEGKLNKHRYQVIDIEDADTITVIKDKNSKPLTIRFIGIDAPEFQERKGKVIYQQKGGKEAQQYTENLIRKSNYEVYVKSYGTDAYGRTLGEIFTTDQQDKSINIKLAETGRALITQGFVVQKDMKAGLEKAVKTAVTQSKLEPGTQYIEYSDNTTPSFFRKELKKHKEKIGLPKDADISELTPQQLERLRSSLTLSSQHFNPRKKDKDYEIYISALKSNKYYEIDATGNLIVTSKYSKGALGDLYKLSVKYDSKSLLPYQPTQLGEDYFQLYGGQPLPEYTLYRDLFKGFTGEEATGWRGTALRWMDHSVGRAGLGTSLNKMIGQDLYQQQAGIGVTVARGIGRFLDTLTGHYDYVEWRKRQQGYYTGSITKFHRSDYYNNEPERGFFESFLGAATETIKSTTLTIGAYFAVSHAWSSVLEKGQDIATESLLDLARRKASGEVKSLTVDLVKSAHLSMTTSTIFDIATSKLAANQDWNFGKALDEAARDYYRVLATKSILDNQDITKLVQKELNLTSAEDIYNIFGYGKDPTAAAKHLADDYQTIAKHSGMFTGEFSAILDSTKEELKEVLKSGKFQSLPPEARQEYLRNIIKGNLAKEGIDIDRGILHFSAFNPGSAAEQLKAPVHWISSHRKFGGALFDSFVLPFLRQIAVVDRSDKTEMAKFNQTLEVLRVLQRSHAQFVYKQFDEAAEAFVVTDTTVENLGYNRRVALAEAWEKVAKYVPANLLLWSEPIRNLLGIQSIKALDKNAAENQSLKSVIGKGFRGLAATQSKVAKRIMAMAKDFRGTFSDAVEGFKIERQLRLYEQKIAGEMHSKDVWRMLHKDVNEVKVLVNGKLDPSQQLFDEAFQELSKAINGESGEAIGRLHNIIFEQIKGSGVSNATARELSQDMVGYFKTLEIQNQHLRRLDYMSDELLTQTNVPFRKLRQGMLIAGGFFAFDFLFSKAFIDRSGASLETQILADLALRRPEDGNEDIAAFKYTGNMGIVSKVGLATTGAIAGGTIFADHVVTSSPLDKVAQVQRDLIFDVMRPLQVKGEGITGQVPQDLETYRKAVVEHYAPTKADGTKDLDIGRIKAEEALGKNLGLRRVSRRFGTFGAVIGMGAAMLYGQAMYSTAASMLNTVRRRYEGAPEPDGLSATVSSRIMKELREAVDSPHRKYNSRQQEADIYLANILTKRILSGGTSGKGQETYSIAVQVPNPIFQISSVVKTDAEGNELAFSMGFQFLPILGIGLTPSLPFAIINADYRRAILWEEQQEYLHTVGIAERAYDQYTEKYLNEWHFRDKWGSTIEQIATLGLGDRLTLFDKSNMSQALLAIGAYGLLDQAVTGLGKSLRKKAVPYLQRTGAQGLAKDLQGLNKIGSFLKGGMRLMRSALMFSQAPLLAAPSVLHSAFKEAGWDTIYDNKLTQFLKLGKRGRTFLPYALGYMTGRAMTNVLGSAQDVGDDIKDPLDKELYQTYAAAQMGLLYGYTFNKTKVFAALPDLLPAGEISDESLIAAKQAYKIDKSVTNKQKIRSITKARAEFYKKIGYQSKFYGKEIRELVALARQQQKITEAADQTVKSVTQEALEKRVGLADESVSLAKSIFPRMSMAAKLLFSIKFGAMALATGISSIFGGETLSKINKVLPAFRMISGVDAPQDDVEVFMQGYKGNAYRPRNIGEGLIYMADFLGNLIPGVRLNLAKKMGLYQDNPSMFLNVAGTLGFSLSSNTGVVRSYHQAQGSTTDVSMTSYVMALSSVSQDTIKQYQALLKGKRQQDLFSMMALIRGATPRKESMSITSAPYNMQFLGAAGVQEVAQREMFAKHASWQRPSEIAIDFLKESFITGRVNDRNTQQQGYISSPLDWLGTVLFKSEAGNIGGAVRASGSKDLDEFIQNQYSIENSLSSQEGIPNTISSSVNLVNSLWRSTFDNFSSESLTSSFGRFALAAAVTMPMITTIHLGIANLISGLSILGRGSSMETLQRTAAERRGELTSRATLYKKGSNEVVGNARSYFTVLGKNSQESIVFYSERGAKGYLVSGVPSGVSADNYVQHLQRGYNSLINNLDTQINEAAWRKGWNSGNYLDNTLNHLDKNLTTTIKNSLTNNLVGGSTLGGAFGFTGEDQIDKFLKSNLNIEDIKTNVSSLAQQYGDNTEKFKLAVQNYLNEKLSDFFDSLEHSLAIVDQKDINQITRRTSKEFIKNHNARRIQKRTYYKELRKSSGSLIDTTFGQMVKEDGLLKSFQEVGSGLGSFFNIATLFSDVYSLAESTAYLGSSDAQERYIASHAFVRKGMEVAAGATILPLALKLAFSNPLVAIGALGVTAGLAMAMGSGNRGKLVSAATRTADWFEKKVMYPLGTQVHKAAIIPGVSHLLEYVGAPVRHLASKVLGPSLTQLYYKAQSINPLLTTLTPETLSVFANNRPFFSRKADWTGAPMEAYTPGDIARQQLSRANQQAMFAISTNGQLMADLVNPEYLGATSDPMQRMYQEVYQDSISGPRAHSGNTQAYQISNTVLFALKDRQMMYNQLVAGASFAKKKDKRHASSSLTAAVSAVMRGNKALGGNYFGLRFFNEHFKQLGEFNQKLMRSSAIQWLFDTTDNIKGGISSIPAWLYKTTMADYLNPFLSTLTKTSSLKIQNLLTRIRDPKNKAFQFKIWGLRAGTLIETPLSVLHDFVSGKTKLSDVLLKGKGVLGNVLKASGGGMVGWVIGATVGGAIGSAIGGEESNAEWIGRSVGGFATAGLGAFVLPFKSRREAFFNKNNISLLKGGFIGGAAAGITSKLLLDVFQGISKKEIDEETERSIIGGTSLIGVSIGSSYSAIKSRVALPLRSNQKLKSASKLFGTFALAYYGSTWLTSKVTGEAGEDSQLTTGIGLVAGSMTLLGYGNVRNQLVYSLRGIPKSGTSIDDLGKFLEIDLSDLKEKIAKTQRKIDVSTRWNTRRILRTQAAKRTISGARALGSGLRTTGALVSELAPATIDAIALTSAYQRTRKLKGSNSYREWESAYQDLSSTAAMSIFSTLATTLLKGRGSANALLLGLYYAPKVGEKLGSILANKAYKDMLDNTDPNAEEPDGRIYKRHGEITDGWQHLAATALYGGAMTTSIGVGLYQARGTAVKLLPQRFRPQPKPTPPKPGRFAAFGAKVSNALAFIPTAIAAYETVQQERNLNKLEDNIQSSDFKQQYQQEVAGIISSSIRNTFSTGGTVFGFAGALIGGVVGSLGGDWIANKASKQLVKEAEKAGMLQPIGREKLLKETRKGTKVGTGIGLLGGLALAAWIIGTGGIGAIPVLAAAAAVVGFTGTFRTLGTYFGAKKAIQEGVQHSDKEKTRPRREIKIKRIETARPQPQAITPPKPKQDPQLIVKSRAEKIETKQSNKNIKNKADDAPVPYMLRIGIKDEEKTSMGQEVLNLDNLEEKKYKQKDAFKISSLFTKIGNILVPPASAAELDKVKQLELDLDKKKEGFSSQQRLSEDSRYLALEKKERAIIEAQKEEESFWGGLWKKLGSTLSSFKDKASRFLKSLWDKLKEKLKGGGEAEEGETENPLYREFRAYKAKSDRGFYEALGFEAQTGGGSGSTPLVADSYAAINTVMGDVIDSNQYFDSSTGLGRTAIALAYTLGSMETLGEGASTSNKFVTNPYSAMGGGGGQMKGFLQMNIAYWNPKSKEEYLKIAGQWLTGEALQPDSSSKIPVADLEAKIKSGEITTPEQYWTWLRKHITVASWQVMKDGRGRIDDNFLQAQIDYIREGGGLKIDPKSFDPTKVSIKGLLGQLKEDTEKAKYFKEQSSQQASPGGIVFPVAGKNRKDFHLTPGMKFHAPRTYRNGIHWGYDYATPQGSNLVALADGKISSVNFDGSSAFGSITVAFQYGGETLYAQYGHISKTIAKIGDTVHAGELIALSGGAKGTPGAGYTGGPHLDLKIYRLKNGQREHIEFEEKLNFWKDAKTAPKEGFGAPQVTPVATTTKEASAFDQMLKTLQPDMPMLESHYNVTVQRLKDDGLYTEELAKVIKQKMNEYNNALPNQEEVQRLIKEDPFKNNYKQFNLGSMPVIVNHELGTVKKVTEKKSLPSAKPSNQQALSTEQQKIVAQVGKNGVLTETQLETAVATIRNAGKVVEDSMQHKQKESMVAYKITSTPQQAAPAVVPDIVSDKSRPIIRQAPAETKADIEDKKIKVYQQVTVEDEMMALNGGSSYVADFEVALSEPALLDSLAV